jgi:hypothetical protein
MRVLEIVVELLRGVAITMLATWLFISVWLFSASLFDGGASAGLLLLNAALMAGTAVYLFMPALVPLGCLLGYLSPILAASRLPPSTAIFAGGALGLVGGACAAGLGIAYFGRDVLPSAMSAHPYWIVLSAAVFAAALVAGYVRLRASTPEG